jgi:hypothetical protein
MIDCKRQKKKKKVIAYFKISQNSSGRIEKNHINELPLTNSNSLSPVYNSGAQGHSHHPKQHLCLYNFYIKIKNNIQSKCFHHKGEEKKILKHII